MRAKCLLHLYTAVFWRMAPLLRSLSSSCVGRVFHTQLQRHAGRKNHERKRWGSLLDCASWSTGCGRVRTYALAEQSGNRPSRFVEKLCWYIKI